MQKHTKFLPLVLALLMCVCLAFAACSQKTADNSDGAQDQTDGKKDQTDGGGTDMPSGGVLVVYFSATNNTEKIAEYIAEATGGALFELVPQVPYSSADLGYNDSNSRVYKEYMDESLRNVPLEKTAVDNWEDYDTVFVGYPIWWGIAAWPVNGFITANDFTGKTVVPFCTSASSGVGQSDKLLAQAAGTGEWKDGARFLSSSSKNDVENWIKGLNIGF